MNETVGKLRPQSVVMAERLIWTSAAIAAFFTIAAYVGLLPFRIPGNAVISDFVDVAFLALCAAKIRAGRNWTRWLMLIVFVLGSLMLPLALLFAPQIVQSMPATLVIVGLVQFAIQLGALILVFMPASSAWFRPNRQVAQ
ncbi:MAG TPA: hypothetical protein VNI78_05500 [Vicinamibacterales bacterium]|nr:hypothetical protein [Vicinamibacterales bacterium]